ncbi:phage tail tube protein [Bacillota bacterium LX-D]|nr:phage tail tube protein [Bacillota bacterium LX-D]
MVGTSNVTEIKNWSLDLGLDTIETTALGDEWKNFIAGLKEWSASAEGSWNVAVDAQGQKALQDAYLSGATVSLKLYVDAAHYYSGEAFISSFYTDATASKQRYEGFGIINSDSLEAAVNDVINETIEIQGVGELFFREG